MNCARTRAATVTPVKIEIVQAGNPVLRQRAHPLTIAEIRSRDAEIPGLHLAGNAYEGIGIPDCIRTGRQAAKNILATS